MRTLWSILGSEPIEILPTFRTMPRTSRFLRFHFLVAFFLSGIVLSPSLFAAPRDAGLPAFVTGLIGKQVELNGSPMLAGATLFPGDVIRLGEDSTAALQFGNSLILAAPQTELVVESQSLQLRNGRIQVRVNGKVPFAISGSFFQLNVAAVRGIAGSAEVRSGGTRAEISSVSGLAEITGSGITPYWLQPGDTAMLSAGEEASAGDATAKQVAGKVSRLIPQVQIDRASQHIVAEVSSGVYWNDDLRSGPTGRAHVTLTDGSQLNLGSESSLRILQHDAQSQQTSLDLIVGRLRGKITKITRPGGKFEIHTPMGVAGLIGTDLSLLVTGDFTELMVFDGAVRFTILNGPSTIVTAGQKLRISKSGVVDGPLPFAPQEAQLAQNLTDITGPNPAPAVAATRPTVPMIIALTGSAIGVGIGVWQGSRPAISTFIP